MLYVGWTAPGEWLNYTVDVAEDGLYSVDILYTSRRGGELSLDVNGKPIDRPIIIADTSDPKDDDRLAPMAPLESQQVGGAQ